MDNWKLVYDRWEPEQRPLHEALCVLGNGYFATRGALCSAKAGGIHYPGTYLAGGYNRLETEVSGRVIENEDLVNWPNWLYLNFRPADGEWFDIDKVEVLEFRNELDIYDGVLTYEITFRDEQQRETTITQRRVVSMAMGHLAAIEYRIIPRNWSGKVVVHSALDGSVENSGVERYRQLNGKHLEIVDRAQVEEEGIFIEARTVQSRILMAQAARTRVFHGELREGVDTRAAVRRQTIEEDQYIAQELTVDVQRQKPIRVEKIVALYTSRDWAISEPGLEARKTVGRVESFQEVLDGHVRTWHYLWGRSDIEIKDNAHAQLVLRLHIFHLLQTASVNSIDVDSGVPARGWHGEAYRGHIFWDELFIFPFVNLRMPELTRSLLLYRYRRLTEARRAADDAGLKGAMFPWQSGSNGREESQVLHLNPRSGRWVPDNTFRQRHVNAAIVYNLWQYYEVTGDMEFLSTYGAELILEVARFWASSAHYNPKRDRYEIRNVVGPDEFHTRYPQGDQVGLNNNAYTNVMAAWVLRIALRVLELLAEERRDKLTGILGFDDEELSDWEQISRKMFVPFHDGGIISQFEGYEQLKEFDWQGYRRKYGDIQRLDRILEAEGDDVNRYKANKQADVLMLFYLFSSEQLEEMFDRLGYPFEPGWIRRNIDYYLERTSHGSTLSSVVHSWVLTRAGRGSPWDLFERALDSDIGDVQGGTTSEGIHLGAMAGTVDIVQRCFTGINITEDVLWLNPCLPEQIDQITLHLHYRGHWLKLRINHRELEICLEPGWAGPAKIGINGQVHTVEQCHHETFELPAKPHRSKGNGSQAGPPSR